MSAAMVGIGVVQAAAAAGVQQAQGRAVPEPEFAFYRKYTEALLRRYLRFSMEKGKVPSRMGQPMFRGRVTAYRIRSFDDAVIFVVDVDRCLKRLSDTEATVIERIALQEYTLAETAAMLRMGTRTVVRRYGEALDRLTGIFLEMGILEPLLACQGEDAG